jgi:hypothetical protein
LRKIFVSENYGEANYILVENNRLIIFFNITKQVCEFFLYPSYTCNYFSVGNRVYVMNLCFLMIKNHYEVSYIGLFEVESNSYKNK